jgi:NADH:ubiquinone oxidoreductase subunit 6 (subunit J)
VRDELLDMDGEEEIARYRFTRRASRRGWGRAWRRGWDGRGAALAVEALLLAGALVCGVALRLHQIRAQIPCDDEWHAIETVVHRPPGWIFTHFGWADYSIPLTLYDAYAARLVGLDELVLRLPVLAAGILALVLLPLLLRPFVGAKTSVVFAWLLAISPLHVYFSRYARPYSIAFLAAAVGVLAFLRWMEDRRARWGCLWAACAAIGPWFHLLMLPFLAAPGAWALWRAWRGRPLPPGFFALSAAAVLGLASLIGPPLVIDQAALADRAGKHGIELRSLLPAFELFSGAQEPLLAFAVGLALLAGAIHLRHAAPVAWRYLLFLCAVQVAALLVSRPAELRVAIVLVRYTLPGLLVFLLAVAAGLGVLDRRLRREWRWIPPHAASVALVAGLLACGPILSRHNPLNRAYFVPNAWTNHGLYQYQYSRAARMVFAESSVYPRQWPAVYREIASVAGPDDRVLEAPWFCYWHCNPFPFYQRLHRRPMLVGFVTPPGEPVPFGEVPPGDRRFTFRNLAHVADLPSLRRAGVRYVVFHRDLAAEMANVMELPRVDVERWIARYRALLGPPWRDDGTICVFELR